MYVAGFSSDTICNLQIAFLLAFQVSQFLHKHLSIHTNLYAYTVLQLLPIIYNSGSLICEGAKYSQFIMQELNNLCQYIAQIIQVRCSDYLLLFRLNVCMYDNFKLPLPSTNHMHTHTHISENLFELISDVRQHTSIKHCHHYRMLRFRCQLIYQFFHLLAGQTVQFIIFR